MDCRGRCNLNKRNGLVGSKDELPLQSALETVLLKTITEDYSAEQCWPGLAALLFEKMIHPTARAYSDWSAHSANSR